MLNHKPEILSEDGETNKYELLFLVDRLILTHILFTVCNTSNRNWNQCYGSVTFWYGSGSGSVDPCLWKIDPDPAIFVVDLLDANQKFSAYRYYFLKVHLHHFPKTKSHKEVQNCTGPYQGGPKKYGSRSATATLNLNTLEQRGTQVVGWGYPYKIFRSFWKQLPAKHHNCDHFFII